MSNTGAASGMGKAIAMLLAGEGGMPYGATAFRQCGAHSFCGWLAARYLPRGRRGHVQKIGTLTAYWKNGPTG